MTQLSGNQFEDDLTVGMEESNVFSTDTIDMFGISGDNESPIARLKSIILSIDWEINDEILKQLDDELLDLGEIWAADKIKQVYVQGLSKIGKYIFRERAGAHPDAIKLLLTFFHNLETIVESDDGMGEEEKKQLLLSDVRKFDKLKVEIGQSPETSRPAEVTATGGSTERVENINELKALKALVLGIDWEITDLELEKLGSEVKRLQVVFANDRPKLILLQGIGALSAYVNKMHSQSNSKAFILLRSFYNVLEQISGNALSAPEQKQLLLVEVSKFKEFKAEIAGISPATPVVEENSPASMSVPESTIEETISPDEDEVSVDVSSRLSSVFGDSDFDSSDEYNDSEKSKALEGVNVETEADDDSDEDALPYVEGGIAPALAEIDEDSSFSVEKLASDLFVASPTVLPEAIVGADIEVDDDIHIVEDVAEVEKNESALMGIDVETEADDDSDEESLPMREGTLAPALSGAAFDGGFDANSIASAGFDGVDSDAIESRLGDFFDDEVASSSEGWGTENQEEIIEEDEETPGDEEGVIAALAEAIDEREDDAGGESEQFLVADDEAFEADESLASALSQFDDDREEGTEEVLGIDEEEIETEGGFVAALSDSDEEDDTETALDFSVENPEVEDSLVAALSKFDDGAEDEVEKILGIDDEILDDGESLVAALSAFDDDGEDEVERAVEIHGNGESLVAALSAFDGGRDDVVKKIADTEDEKLNYDKRLTEDSSDLVSENLVDIEENISVESTKGFEEPDVDQEFTFFEDDTLAPSVFDRIEDIAVGDEIELKEEVEETVESGLAFLDEELESPTSMGFDAEDVPPIVGKSPDEEIAFAVEFEDFSEDDEIEFTVPGTEIVETLTKTDGTVAEEEELVEFDLPGEGGEDVVTFMPDKDKRSDEVIFEAVTDDVALDLLPGEEFDDSESLDAADIDIAEEKEDIQFTAAAMNEIVSEAVDTEEPEWDEDRSKMVSASGTGKYKSLAILVTTLEKNIVEEGIQDVFMELDKLRSRDTSYTEKTFLQLLSSVCQYLEKNPNSVEGITLMRDIVSGLEMSDSGDVSSDRVQESLFSSTSNFLIFQQKEIDSLLSGSAQEPELQTEDTLETVDETQAKTDSEQASIEEYAGGEQLASYVQKELADIRKLFGEEIENLRKELSGK